MELPRWQRIFLGVSTALWGLLVASLLWLEWRRGVPGSVLWVNGGIRLLQGAGLLAACLGIWVKVLAVDAGILEVVTLGRRLLRRPGIQVPLQDVALEWIGRELVMQAPDTGLPVRLATGPSAYRAAKWLVARGARPPVGS
jgi:hypothetical protein